MGYRCSRDLGNLGNGHSGVESGIGGEDRRSRDPGDQVTDRVGQFPRPDRATLAGLEEATKRAWSRGGHELLLRAMQSGDFTRITKERGDRIYNSAIANISAFETFIETCADADRPAAQLLLARWHNAAAWTGQRASVSSGPRQRTSPEGA